MNWRITFTIVAVLIGVGCAREPDAALEPIGVVSTLDLSGLATTAVTAASTIAPPPTTTTPTTTTTTTSAPAPTAAPTTGAPSASQTTVPPTQATSGSGDLRPAFFSFDASTPNACPASDSVTLRWEVLGTESVYLAIDDVDRPVVENLPAAGSIALPRACPGGTTYYVVAENPDGRTVEQATR